MECFAFRKLWCGLFLLLLFDFKTHAREVMCRVVVGGGGGVHDYVRVVSEVWDALPRCYKCLPPDRCFLEEGCMTTMTSCD